MPIAREEASDENEEVGEEPTENRRKESSSKEVGRVVEIGQAITFIMKGIHSTASPTVSLSDVVADSCLNLIGPYARPSIHSLFLSCDFFYDIV
jgi:hypothetical protein